MRTISQVLDRARVVQKVRSDYKLGLCLGIGGNSLSNYRTGRSLPDEKAVQKLAQAIGEKPDLLLVETQAQRVKDPESRAMWENIARRLQAGFANVQMLLSIALICIAALAIPVWAAAYFASFSVRALCILCKVKNVRIWVLLSHLCFRNVKFCKPAFFRCLLNALALRV